MKRVGVVMLVLVVTSVITGFNLKGQGLIEPSNAIRALSPWSKEHRSANPPRAQRSVKAEGRVVAYPDAEVTVGSEVAGRVTRILVKELDRVRQGDLLIELNADDLKAALAESRARLEEAESDIRFAEREVRRARDLVVRRSSTPSDLDAREHSLEASVARRAIVVATIQRDEALIEKSLIRAPIAGVVIAREVDHGEIVEPARKLLTLFNPERTRVEIEVDEYDANSVQLGAAVTITAEGHKTAWKGQVEELGWAVTGRRNRPVDPGLPLDMRILPVKVKLLEPTPLRLGQKIEASVAVATAVDGSPTEPTAKADSHAGEAHAQPAATGDDQRSAPVDSARNELRR